jgi:aminoglycoside phosphotransferase
VKSLTRLPADVRSAAETALGGERFDSEFAWLSWAGTVWRLKAESGVVYVKRAADLRDERDRMVWLAGRLPVPELVGFLRSQGDDWLLTRELPGVPLYHPSLGWEPARVARRFGEILMEIHSTNSEGCPFGEATPTNVLIHGDYCLPNVLVEVSQSAGRDGRLAGLVDVGRAGLGDPRDDLAAGLWTLDYNFGHGFAPEFLHAYGAPPMAEKEIEKLRRRYGKRRPARQRVGP